MILAAPDLWPSKQALCQIIFDDSTQGCALQFDLNLKLGHLNDKVFADSHYPLSELNAIRQKEICSISENVLHAKLRNLFAFSTLFHIKQYMLTMFIIRWEFLVFNLAIMNFKK